jgi:hypothetical protein
MTPITYYYFISIMLAVGPMLWLANLVYLRRKGRTTFGQSYAVGTPEYKRVIKLASSRNMAITIAIELPLVANLIYSVFIVLGVNTPDSRFILIFAPIATAILLTLAIVKLRKENRG